MRKAESELEEKIVERCGELGLMCFRAKPGERGGLTPRGWPDLVIAGPGGLVFRELKSARGRLDPGQWRVYHQLTEAGADYQIWRPRDWQMVIEPCLRGLTVDD